jgi:hypothetical protein
MIANSDTKIEVTGAGAPPITPLKATHTSALTPSVA